MPRPCPPRRCILRDTRGSIFVETLLFIPLLALLWTLLNYEYDINRTGMATQERARTCAWQYAARGCTGGMPAGCTIDDLGTLDDTALRGLSMAAYATIATSLPFLAPTLASLHGEVIRATDEAVVTRPRVLGGVRHTKGSVALMCNTVTNEWEVPFVFVLTVTFVIPSMML